MNSMKMRSQGSKHEVVAANVQSQEAGTSTTCSGQALQHRPQLHNLAGLEQTMTKT